MSSTLRSPVKTAVIGAGVKVAILLIALATLTLSCAEECDSEGEQRCDDSILEVCQDGEWTESKECHSYCQAQGKSGGKCVKLESCYSGPPCAAYCSCQ